MEAASSSDDEDFGTRNDPTVEFSNEWRESKVSIALETIGHELEQIVRHVEEKAFANSFENKDMYFAHFRRGLLKHSDGVPIDFENCRRKKQNRQEARPFMVLPNEEANESGSPDRPPSPHLFMDTMLDSNDSRDIPDRDWVSGAPQELPHQHVSSQTSFEPVAGPSGLQPIAGPSRPCPMTSSYSLEMRPSGLGVVLRRIDEPRLHRSASFPEQEQREDSREGAIAPPPPQSSPPPSPPARDVIVLDDDETFQRQPQVNREVVRVGKLEMCNAIFLDGEIPEGWERPPTCLCNPMPYDVLGATNLPPALAANFLEMSNYSVQNLADTLKMYGESNISSGCKTRLLKQLKELLIAQSPLTNEESSRRTLDREEAEYQNVLSNLQEEIAKTREVLSSVRDSPPNVKVEPSTSRVAPSTSRAAPSTSRTAPSTSRTAPSTSRAAPSTSRVAPSISRPAPSASRPASSTSRVTPSTSQVAQVAPSTSREDQPVAIPNSEPMAEGPWSARFMPNNMGWDHHVPLAESYRDPRVPKKRSLLSRVMESSSDSESETDYSVSYFKMKRNKQSSCSGRQRTQPPTAHQLTPPAVSPNSQQDSDNEDFSVWNLSRRRRSAGPPLPFQQTNLPEPIHPPVNQPRLILPAQMNPVQMFNAAPNVTVVPHNMPDGRPVPPAAHQCPNRLLQMSMHPRNQPQMAANVPNARMVGVQPWPPGPNLTGMEECMHRLRNQQAEETRRLREKLLEEKRIERQRANEIAYRRQLMGERFLHQQQQRQLQRELAPIGDRWHCPSSSSSLMTDCQARVRAQQNLLSPRVPKDHSPSTSNNAAATAPLVTPPVSALPAASAATPVTTVAPTSLPGTSATAASASVATSSKPTDESKDVPANLECCICLEASRNMCFKPCHHVTCCPKCAYQVEECPICRQKIEDRFKIFL